MKLGSAGEAFFVHETLIKPEDNKELTSPIASDDEVEAEALVSKQSASPDKASEKEKEVDHNIEEA